MDEQVLRETVSNCWRLGKSFGTVGLIFTGVECVIEKVGFVFSLILFFFFLFPSSLNSRTCNGWRSRGKRANSLDSFVWCDEQERAKHDIVNGVLAGCITGGILGARGGPKGITLGCAGFAAFSTVIDSFTGH